MKKLWKMMILPGWQIVRLNGPELMGKKGRVGKKKQYLYIKAMFISSLPI